MHDYHKAVDMVNYGVAQASKQGKRKVTKITLVMGDSCGYSEESIRMYFDEVSAGTVCEGAQICVEHVKAKLKCPQCGKLFERKPMHLTCPDCGVEGEPTDVGTQIEIKSAEML